MKKFIRVLQVVLCLIVLSNAKNNGDTTVSQTSEKKILIVYFSHSGNTRTVAKQIQIATKADIFEIVPVDKYPKDYNTLVNQARKEIDANYKPKLTTKVTNIQQYDKIFIGSPNWWSTFAPPVSTFLHSYDLSGKTIIPFLTHGGSGLGHSVSDMKKLYPKATFLDGLAIRGDDVQNANADIMKWLREIKIVK